MRYYFHLSTGREIVLDDCGLERSDLDEVRIEVMQAIEELRDENPFANWDGWRFDVTDATGSRLFSVFLTTGSVRQYGVISGVAPGRHDQAALGVI